MPLNTSEQTEFDVLVTKWPRTSEEQDRFEILVRKGMEWPLYLKIMLVVLYLPKWLLRAAYEKINHLRRG